MSVLSVSTSATSSFSKTPCESIRLLIRRGVQGDSHCTPLPTASAKQIHLIPSSIFALLPALNLAPGMLGENITTQDIDLFSLPTDALLIFGEAGERAVVRITGIREPKKRLDEWPAGLLEKSGGRVGVYGVVEGHGEVRAGMEITAVLPKGTSALIGL